MSRKRQVSNNNADKENKVFKTRNRSQQGESNEITRGLDHISISDSLVEGATSPALRQAAVLKLQRTHGNTFVQRMINRQKGGTRQPESREKDIQISAWGKVRYGIEGEQSARVQRSETLGQTSPRRSLSWGIQRKATVLGSHRRAQIAPGSSQSDLATTRLRISRLKSTSRVLSDLANEPIPPGLSRQEAQVEEKYANWLSQSSERLEQLAVQGANIVKAAMTGRIQRQTSDNAQSRHTLQRMQVGSTQSSVYSGPSIGRGSLSNLASAGSGDSEQLMIATREMQEMNMSFNLQYLQLQQDMQNENRQFTMMSNIMKTKHDTAKNAINNVR